MQSLTECFFMSNIFVFVFVSNRCIAVHNNNWHNDKLPSSYWKLNLPTVVVNRLCMQNSIYGRLYIVGPFYFQITIRISNTFIEYQIQKFQGHQKDWFFEHLESNWSVKWNIDLFFISNIQLWFVDRNH